MPDVNELTKTIKRAALQAVNAEKPVEVCFGVVTSVSPLKINVEQKLTLGESQLVLSRNVTDFQTKISFDNSEINQPVHVSDAKITDTIVLDPNTPEAESHKCIITDTMTGKMQLTAKVQHDVTVYNALRVGEEVLLLRMQGGQKYIVYERVVTI